MYRCVLFLMAAITVSTFAAVDAQNPDDRWKDLVTQALYAVSDHQFGQAESLFNKAIQEAQHFGLDDARVGTTLNSLGLVYQSQKKFAAAEGAYRKALPIVEKANGPGNVDVADVTFNLAAVLVDEKKHATALPYLVKTLESYESLFGGTSVRTASVLCLMGESHRFTKDYLHAASDYKRCADIREADGGIQNVELADALRGRALNFAAQGKLGLAESNFKLAEKIVEITSGLSSPQLAVMIEEHIAILKQMGGHERDIERLANRRRRPA